MTTLSTDELDLLFSPAFTLSEELKVQYFNPALSTLLQLPPRKIKEQKVKELFPLDERFWNDLKERTQEQGSAISEEIDFSIGNENYTFVFRLKKVDSLILCVSNDLSVEKSLHGKYREQLELLKKSHQQVVQADKVRALGELTAGISHEINNPLTVASGNNELLGFALETEDLNDQRDVLTQCQGNIDEALTRIQTIIAGMKGFLHQDSQGEDKKEYIELKSVIDNSLKLTQGTLDSASIKSVVNIPEGGHVVLGNQTRLEQIVINLIQNATDSMRDAGVQNPTLKIELKRDPEKHQISLNISDNGPGVSAEVKDQIFENFFTTKEMGKGTGLGLSLCQKIAEDHQGSLRLIDKEGGAHFELCLPIIEVSSFASNDEIFSKLNDIHGKKILVVDNDVTILNLCQKFMESTSFIFIGSTGGEEALEVLNKYDVDAVITDLNMPGIDGSTFVKHLRQSYGPVPVFYLSDTSGMDQYKKDKEALNLSGMLVKPFKSSELVSLLEEAFKG